MDKHKIYLMQRETFQKIIKKRHPELFKEWKDLFAEYYIDFDSGRVKSINDFLYCDRLAPVEKRKLKRGFVDGR